LVPWPNDLSKGFVFEELEPWTVARDISSKACSYSSGDSRPGESEEALVCAESESIDDSEGRLTIPPVGTIGWKRYDGVRCGREGTANGRGWGSTKAGRGVVGGAVGVGVNTCRLAGRKGSGLGSAMMVGKEGNNAFIAGTPWAACALHLFWA
jgi:hypothetical protein